MQVIAIIVAGLFPLAYAVGIYKLNYLKTNKLWLVIASGLSAATIGFGIAYIVNKWFFTFLPRQLVVGGTAPVLEEILKSLILWYLVSRVDFTYFVDGAVYGFTAGIGFAAIENVFYVMSNPAAGLGLAISRLISTNLMHASASGLVGIGFGRSRTSRGVRKWLVLLYFLGAMLLHITFNNAVTLLSGILIIIVAVAIAGLAGFFIWRTLRQGMAEEKRKIDAILGEEDQVTDAEKRVVGKLGEKKLDQILSMIGEKFGKANQEKCSMFLLKQAHLGIYRNMALTMPEGKLKEGTQAAILRLQKEMEILRKGVGAYVMSYVRSAIPSENLNFMKLLEERVPSVLTGAEKDEYDEMMRQYRETMNQRIADQPKTGLNFQKLLGEKLAQAGEKDKSKESNR
jgi:RsiW-degrading membrane proteinase PrsW (M82 family)